MCFNLKYNLWLKNVLLSSSGKFSKIANCKRAMRANPAKATFQAPNDYTGSGRRFRMVVLGECFDHLLSAVAVNLQAPAEPGQPLLCKV